MAVLHRWDYTGDPASTQCGIHPSANERPSEQGKTADRITGGHIIGGLPWARCRTMPGDTGVAGSNEGYRADVYISSIYYAPTNGTIHTYFQRFLVRPGVDYFPPSNTNWNSIAWGWHRNTGGWPGGTCAVTYCTDASAQTGNSAEWNPSNITSPASTYPRQVNGLMLELFGGQFLDSSGNPVTIGVSPGCDAASHPGGPHTCTPNRINMEQWLLFAPGWAGKAVEISYRIKWSANIFDGGSKFYHNNNGGTGTPISFTNSGWWEIQYRLGTIGASSITWGPWTWYNPPDITFANGGRQRWQNGPEPYRHYRPTMWYYNDTSTYDQPYWKMMHNYHQGDNQDSSVYHGLNIIAQTFTDLGLAEPGGAPPPQAPANTSPPTISGTMAVGQTANLTAGAWTNSPTNYTYTIQRYSGSTLIGTAATFSSASAVANYTIVAADLGYTLKLSVLASNAAGSATATSLASATVVGQFLPLDGPPSVVRDFILVVGDGAYPAGKIRDFTLVANPPANTVLPAITGTQEVGQDLTCSAGTWDHSPNSFLFTWERDGHGDGIYNTVVFEETDATGPSTYTLVDADDQCKIRCVVTASNTTGESGTIDTTTTVNSLPTGLIVEPDPVNTVDPSISGTPQVHVLLIADPGTWDNLDGYSPTVAITYQWETSPDGLGSWTVVTGATNQVYIPTEDDFDQYFRVKVIATNSGGSAFEYADAVGPVVAAPPVEEVALLTVVEEVPELETFSQRVWDSLRPIHGE